MDLQLGLALCSSLVKGFDLNQDCDTNKRKRAFDEAFCDVNKNLKGDQILPWLVWDDKRHREEESLVMQEEVEESVTSHNSKVDVEDNVVVGWPPVKSWGRKFSERNHRECATNYVTVENGGGGRHVYNSIYVKVKMEGVGITRKIDLSIHTSYETLIATLIVMFGKCQENVEMYKLTYQDKEGDWLLAGDVPWGSFTQSVQRLKLLRNSN